MSTPRWSAVAVVVLCACSSPVGGPDGGAGGGAAGGSAGGSAGGTAGGSAGGTGGGSAGGSGCTTDPQCATASGCDAGCWCSAGSCAPLQANSATCAADRECSSGHCTDGVCCAVGAASCSGCRACNVTGFEGDCHDVPQGQDPHSACAADAGACLLPDCNGAGSCTAPDGLPCGGSTCSMDIQTDRLCSGGTCGPQSRACDGGFGCNGPVCQGTCAVGTDLGCPGGAYCVGTTQCLPKKANGASCAAANECTSSLCALSRNGQICSAVACTDLCSVANATGSACEPALQGTDPKNDCTASVATCKQDTCDGTSGPGACNVVDATPCGPPTCTGGTAIFSTCTAGSCNARTTSCNGFSCNGPTCGTTCTASGGCEATHYCSGSTCAPKLATGSPCTSAGQCVTGICETAQTGSLLCATKSCSQTCGVIDPTGTSCNPVAAGTDPESECTANLAGCQQSTCNGTSGATACAAPINTACGAAGCSSGSRTTSTCSSSGTCQTNTFSCGASGCYQGSCNTTGPTFAGDASADVAMLSKVANLGGSMGSAPANTPVVVTMMMTPHGSVQSLTLTWTNDDFGTVVPVAMGFTGESGANDVYTGTIPGQAAGRTVRFYFVARDWVNTSTFNPGNNVNYTYVTQ